MSAPLLVNFVVPAASSVYVDIYVQPCSKLKFFIDITSSSSIGNVTLVDGMGGPSDPNIIYPWVQALPNVWDINAHPTTTPIWGPLASGTAYTPVANGSGKQFLEIVVNRALGTDWLSINIPAAVGSSANINIYAEPY